ncbi:MAG: hypothetical protein IH991_15830 [Planctomycetes bacterium]|nr:hypothetical protein [Planctomycetota bacterium]
MIVASVTGSALSPEEALVVTAQFKIKKGTNEGVLAVTAKPAPRWYTYSITQLEGGGLRSQIIVSKSDDYVVDAAEFKPDNGPTIVKDPNFKVPLEEHKKTVTWTAPLRLTDGTDVESLKIQLLYNGQVCEEGGQCIPIFDRKLAASFAGYIEPPRAVGVAYQATGKHTTIRGHIEPRVAAPGDRVRVVLTATPDFGYHVYALEATDPLGDYKPTLIAIDAAAWQVSKPVASGQPTAKDNLTYYESEVTWTIDIQVPKDAKPGEHTIKGSIGYQACTDSTCDFPGGAAFTIKIPVADKSESGQTGLSFSPVSYGSVAKAAEQAAKRPTKTDSPAKEIVPGATGEFRAGSNSHVLIKGYIEPTVATPGGKVKLVLSGVPDDTYHIYQLSDRLLTEGSAQPTLISLTKKPDWKASRPTASKPTKPDPKNVDYYEGEVSWTIEFDIPPDAQPGDYDLQGIIGYQVCQSVGLKLCDPPVSAKFSTTLRVADNQVAGRSPLVFQKASYKSAVKAAEQALAQTGDGSTSEEAADGAVSALLVATILVLGFLATFLLSGGVWQFRGLPASFFGLSLVLAVALVAAVLHQVDKTQSEPTLWTLLAVAFGAWLIARVPEKTSAAKRAVTIGTAAGIAGLIGASFFIGKEVVPACALIGGGGFAIWVVMKIPNGATLRRKMSGFSVAAIGLLLAGGIAWIAFQATELPWEKYSSELLQKHREDGHIVLVDFTADW